MPRSKTTLLGTPDNLGGHRVNIAILKEANLVACSLVNPAIFSFIAAIGQFERSGSRPEVYAAGERVALFLLP
jgi:hypothetical protein